jgi:hypothetical protein
MLDRRTQSKAHPQSERGDDLYDTPAAAVQALMRAEQLPHHIWEPAVGRGAIVTVLRDAGRAVITSDLVDYGFPLHFVGDFLAQEKLPTGVECILTNPPFNRRILTKFIAHALDLCPRVILLARLALLETTSRTEILEHRRLTRVHVFRDRIDGMHRANWTGNKARSGMAFAWFVWERDHQGPPTIHRISTETGNGRAGTKRSKQKEMTMAKPDTSRVIAESGTPEEVPTTTPTPDPFDLANLCLPQNFAESAGVRKLLKTVPVKKPGRQDFIRVHSDPAYRGIFSMIILEEDRETYLVAGVGMAVELAGEAINVTLHTAVNRQGVTFLWPVRLPDADGRDLEWYRSAREAAAEATKGWIRVTADKNLSAYQIFAAEITAEPKWPEVSFQELIRIAFRDRLITSLDHPVVKRLRGQA